MSKRTKKKIELSKSVPRDKFDSHMKKARENTMDSHEKVFFNQCGVTADKKGSYTGIEPSIY